MLFNSISFIGIFLPLTLLFFFAMAKYSTRGAIAVLLLASLLFYAWWNPAYVPLLLTSIAFNFLIGIRITDALARKAHEISRRWLIFGIAIDLLLLGFYKYAGFFIGTINNLSGATIPSPEIVLPLGISFFTFTQIAYLVDAHQGKVRDQNPLHFGLFVTYFPHLIAGPVLHHKQMMPQFSRPDVYRFSAERLAEGLAIFLLGLSKKVLIADRFGEFATPGFAAAAAGQEVTTFAAWGAALSYTFQLYFDFSGYSDMAIGLGRMMGIELPRNFASPYKAVSISDFWRRWHMTLSAFLRDYLYIPLGGNRQGKFRRHVNLMATMLLGGLWHGAGWTFVIWGGLHGALLVVNHLWREAVSVMPQCMRLLLQGPTLRPAYWALTFISVVIGWVFFRADSMGSAMILLRGMSGHYGTELPAQVLALMPSLQETVTGAGTVKYLADGTVMGFAELLVMLTFAFVAVLATPSVLDQSSRQRLLLIILSAAFVIQRIGFGHASEFLYFQF